MEKHNKGGDQKNATPTGKFFIKKRKEAATRAHSKKRQFEVAGGVPRKTLLYPNEPTDRDKNEKGEGEKK